ncbi:MAG: PaaI family thioesterase [Firmicutes bacterium]|nr:PaaI family thioesterase [Bacillota bacterium]
MCTEGKKPELTGQEALEAHARETLRSNNEDQKDTMNGMMKSEWGGCSFEEKTLTFDFPAQQWQANRIGNMHGGAICTAFDLTIAALARFYARENFAPTINLDVNYIRPVAVGEVLAVTAKATSTGRRITQLTAEARIKSTGKLAATASSIYMNVDTDKERQAPKERQEKKKSGQTGYISSLMNYSDRL